MRNRDKREDFIKAHGEDDFERISKLDPKWKQLENLTLPIKFSWIWSQFIQIWGTCEHDFNGNVIFTPRAVLDYCECFKVSMTVYERRLLFRMKSWACDEKSKVDDKEEQ